jgi:antitoxin ParD1/3/4
MTSITLTLSPELEARLRELVSERDEESIRQLLAEALIPRVKELLGRLIEPINIEEFETESERLMDEFAEYLGADAPLLSDYAVSREGIYEDHP